jgi:hypothetical protein
MFPYSEVLPPNAMLQQNPAVDICLPRDSGSRCTAARQLRHAAVSHSAMRNSPRGTKPSIGMIVDPSVVASDLPTLGSSSPDDVHTERSSAAARITEDCRVCWHCRVQVAQTRKQEACHEGGGQLEWLRAKRWRTAGSVDAFVGGGASRHCVEQVGAPPHLQL